MNDSSRRDDKLVAPDSGEREWFARLTSEYAPKPLSGVERQLFEQRVRRAADGVGSHSLAKAHAGRKAALTVVLAASAVLLWIALPRSPATEPRIERDLIETSALQSWERQVLQPPEFDADDDRSLDAMLPADYAAIESVFF